MISTERRIEYALGYVSLLLFEQAAEELGAIAFEDQSRADVTAACVELNMAAKRWTTVVGFASRLTEIDPANAQGWVSWAYALREMNLVGAARNVLLQAEPTHGALCAIIPYNLACYNCVLGEIAAAKQYLSRACRMDGSLREDALDDADLEPMWHQIEAM